MRIEIDGTDEIKKDLDRIIRNAKELEGAHSVKVIEILTQEFIRKHSDYASLEEMLTAPKLLTNGEKLTEKRLASIPVDQVNRIVAEKTDFPDWHTMVRKALDEYVGRRIMEGVG